MCLYVCLCIGIPDCLHACAIVCVCVGYARMCVCFVCLCECVSICMCICVAISIFDEWWGGVLGRRAPPVPEPGGSLGPQGPHRTPPEARALERLDAKLSAV